MSKTVRVQEKDLYTYELKMLSLLNNGLVLDSEINVVRRVFQCLLEEGLILSYDSNDEMYHLVMEIE